MEEQKPKRTMFDRGRELVVEQKAATKRVLAEKRIEDEAAAARIPKPTDSDEDALKLVGYTQKQMSRILKRSGTNSEFFVMALAREGIGPPEVARGLVEGLRAGTPMVRKGQVVLDPHTKEMIIIADHHTRLAYWDRIISILGAVHKTKDEAGPQVSPTFVTVINRFDRLNPEKQRRALDGDYTVLEEDTNEGNGNSDHKKRF